MGISNIISLNLLLLLFISNFVSLNALYDVGQTYKYNYATTIKLDEPDKTRSKEVTYQVTADVSATTVWQNPSSTSETLFLLQVNNQKLWVTSKNEQGEFTSHSSPLDKYTDKNIILHMKDGSVLDLFVEDDVSPFFYFKMGIASLFQFQVQNAELEEVDISGKCTVAYKVSGDTIQKTKRDCVSFQTSHRRPIYNGVLNHELMSETLTTYQMTKDQVISSLYSLESHIFRLNIMKNNGALVNSVQKMDLLNQEDGSSSVVQGSTVQESIAELIKLTGRGLKRTKFDMEKQATGSQCKKLPNLIKDKQASLKAANLGKMSSVATFLDVVQEAGVCDKDTLVKIMKNSKNKAILPQILDVAAASQTLASFQAVLEILNFESDSTDLPERFLTSLSVIPHPDGEVLHSLFKLSKQGIRNRKLQDTVLQTLGSVAKTYFKQNGKDKLITDVQSWLTDQLQECQSQECKLPYLRALRNAALPETIAVALSIIKQGGKAATEALKILQAIFDRNAALPEETKTILNQVYYQLLAKQDTSARIVAAEVLLESDPNLNDIQNVFLSLSSNASFEVNTYILSKIKEVMGHDHVFNEKVREVLRHPLIGNYDILAQKGGSTLFKNSFFDGSQVNATYGLYMEMIPGGLLKHSDFKVDLNYQGSDLPILSFGMFAGGLGGLVGEEGQTEEESQEDMTAGIQLGVLGSKLRPYTLFTGQGELMSLVWSGTGSETTPILQGNYLLQDHQQSVILQNGILLDIALLGAISYDLSGSVQISLWNRNSHSIITNKGAVVFRSKVSLDADFIKAQVGVTTAIEGSLEFVTDLEFYESPFKMCTQMIQSPVLMKRVVTKTERIPGSKHRIRRTRRVKNQIAPRSFNLHRKNSLLCSLMLN